ncbi:MAG TPA: hypothetical protein VGR28_02390 [Candidatus Thermoplasmatota archaeon]|jgi:hypothetical protein|nr:hypothetical protein [Candidatus Thermoplasmatota archaeon]
MRAGFVVALLVGAATLAGCTNAGFSGNAGTYGGPNGGASVSNNPGTFGYSGGVADKSGAERYTWTNGSPTAQVSWSGGGSGSLSVVLEDAAGKEVFRQTFRGSGGASGAQRSAPGVPGSWHIKLTFSDYSGGLALSIQSG